MLLFKALSIMFVMFVSQELSTLTSTSVLDSSKKFYLTHFVFSERVSCLILLLIGEHTIMVHFSCIHKKESLVRSCKGKTHYSFKKIHCWYLKACAARVSTNTILFIMCNRHIAVFYEGSFLHSNLWENYACIIV